jgi:hypothetical protein
VDDQRSNYDEVTIGRSVGCGLQPAMSASIAASREWREGSGENISFGGFCVRRM